MGEQAGGSADAGRASSFRAWLPRVEHREMRRAGEQAGRVWSAVPGRAGRRKCERAGGRAGGRGWCWRAAGSAVEQGCPIRLPAFRLLSRGRTTAPRGDSARILG